MLMLIKSYKMNKIELTHIHFSLDRKSGNLSKHKIKNKYVSS